MTTDVEWPTDLIAAECEFFLRHNTTAFESPITRSRQVLRRPGERWVGTYRMPPLAREDAQRMDALLAKLRGGYGLVAMWDHARPSPAGDNLDHTGLGPTWFTDGTRFVEAGSPTVTTTFTDPDMTAQLRLGAARGDDTLYSEGWYPNTTALLAGDYLELDGWLYMLTEDAEVNGAGRATLSIAPRVRADVAAGTVLGRTRASTPMRLVDDQQPNRRAQPGGWYDGYVLSFVEDLEAA